MSDKLPDAWFGQTTEVGDALPEVDEADDDEELPETPTDVVALLGFDPLDPE